MELMEYCTFNIKTKFFKKRESQIYIYIEYIWKVTKPHN